MGYSGAGGKLIDEKNQKQKISWHCPFKGNFSFWTKHIDQAQTGLFVNWMYAEFNSAKNTKKIYENLLI